MAHLNLGWQEITDAVAQELGRHDVVAISLTDARESEVPELGRLLVVDPETGQTSLPHVFAGGDCVNGGKEVVNAAAEGKRAARGLDAYLRA